MFLQDIQLIEVKVVQGLKADLELARKERDDYHKSSVNRFADIKKLENAIEFDFVRKSEHENLVGTLRKKNVELQDRLDFGPYCPGAATEIVRLNEVLVKNSAEIEGLKEALALNQAILREAQNRVEFLQENPARVDASRIKELQARNDKQQELILTLGDERRVLREKVATIRAAYRVLDLS